MAVIGGFWRVNFEVAMQVVHAQANHPRNGFRRQDEYLCHLWVVLEGLEGPNEVLLAKKQLASISTIRLAYIKAKQGGLSIITLSRQLNKHAQSVTRFIVA